MKYLAFFLVCLPVSSLGAVLQSSEHGFISEHKVVLAASPANAYEALTKSVHRWWDAAHSYGKDASTFTLEARAGGCFCEALANGGSVEHMRVVRAIPGSILVMQGALGPLQNVGVTGSMSFTLRPHADGTELIYRYVVGGYSPGGLKEISTPVDRVQLGQLRRLQRFIATGNPNRG